MVRTAYRSFKLGLIFLVLDLKIDGIDLLPDLVGWMFFIGALHGLAGIHPAFRRARRLGWLILGLSILRLIGVSWFESATWTGLPFWLPTGPIWFGADRLAAALPDLLELAFVWNVSSGLIAALESCSLPADGLRRRLGAYAWVGLVAIGLGLFVTRPAGQASLSQLDTASSLAVPLVGLLLIKMLFLLILLFGWRQSFAVLPDELPALAAAPPRWRPRRSYAIAGLLALGVWISWAALSVPPSGRIVHKLAGGFGIAEYGGNAAFSPDGTRLAVVNLDGPTKIYAAASGELERELPDDHILDLDFSPDGRQLATIGNDLTVYDAQSGREIWRLALGGDHVRWSPDGRQLALLSGPVSLVDVEAMTVTSTLEEGKSYFGAAIDYSPDSQRLAETSPLNQTLIWDTTINFAQKRLGPKDSKVSDVAWSPDGTMLATADDHNVVSLWDVDKQRIVRQFAISTVFDKLLGRRPYGNSRNWTSSVAFSPDGALLAAGSSDASAGVWSVASGRQLLTLNGQTDHIGSVAFSPDGRQVLTASTDQTLWLWNIEEAYR
jgi:WD40 repeat protein